MATALYGYRNLSAHRLSATDSLTKKSRSKIRRLSPAGDRRITATVGHPRRALCKGARERQVKPPDPVYAGADNRVVDLLRRGRERLARLRLFCSRARAGLVWNISRRARNRERAFGLQARANGQLELAAVCGLKTLHAVMHRQYSVSTAVRHLEVFRSH